MTQAPLPLIASAQALQALAARVGEAPLASGWMEVDQHRVDRVDAPLVVRAAEFITLHYF